MIAKPPAPNPSGLCMCGCGQTTPVARCTALRDGTVYGEHIRFVLGHNSFAKRGSPWFNTRKGRWYIYGRSNSQHIPWARVALANKIGRDLTTTEQAHHINGIKDDDRPENLDVLDISEHTRHHLRAAGVVTNQFGTWPLRHPRSPK